MCARAVSGEVSRVCATCMHQRNRPRVFSLRTTVTANENEGVRGKEADGVGRMLTCRYPLREIIARRQIRRDASSALHRCASRDSRVTRDAYGDAENGWEPHRRAGDTEDGIRGASVICLFIGIDILLSTLRGHRHY